MDREGREQFLRKLTRPSDLRRVLFLFLTVVCLFHRFFLFFTFVSFLSSAFMEIGELNWNRLTHPSRKERPGFTEGEEGWSGGGGRGGRGRLGPFSELAKRGEVWLGLVLALPMFFLALVVRAAQTVR